MKALVYITPSPSTVRSFLTERIKYLSDEYDITVICSPEEEMSDTPKGVRILTRSYVPQW